jgi:hypothetical protein
MVTNARQVADTAATDENHGVFLQVVVYTGDIGGNFAAVTEAYTGDLSKGRVRLLRGHGFDLEADAALLATAVQIA